MKNTSEDHHKAYIRQLIYDNKIIDAIKYIRDLTGMGLKESKELCEMFYNDLTKLDDYSFITNESTEQDQEFEIPATEDELFKNITAMLLNNRKIMAIKYAKEILKIGLKEAKDLVDSLDDGKSKKDVVIAGENEDLLVEIDKEENSEQEKNAMEIMFGPEDDQITEKEEPETLKVEIKKEKPKKKRNSSYSKEYEQISFAKVDRFDNKKKRKNRSNSGCMITLTVMIALIIILTVAF